MIKSTFTPFSFSGNTPFNTYLQEQEEQEGVANESYEKNEDELQSEFDEDDYRKTFINKNKKIKIKMFISYKVFHKT